MTEKLYNLPKYYDVAFSWNISREIKLFCELFDRHVPFEVKNILEPACGTGRFLIGLPEYGYHVMGYDNNPQMLAYAGKRIADAGFRDMATAVSKDMKTAAFNTKFDSAISSINSLGYLLSDDDIVEHFRNTGKSLRSGGIYIIQISCAWDKLESHGGEEWVEERDGIKVKTNWSIEREDRQKKLSYQVCKMEIDDNGRHIEIEDRHTLRLWLFEDIKDLINKSGSLKLEAVYNGRGVQIPLDTHITGESGNLYYVLKAL